LDLLDGIEHELHEPRERVVDVFVVHHHDPLGTGPFPQVILKAADAFEVSDISLRRPGAAAVGEVASMEVLILHDD
jgi:hypothetical protein